MAAGPTAFAHPAMRQYVRRRSTTQNDGMTIDGTVGAVNASCFIVLYIVTSIVGRTPSGRVATDSHGYRVARSKVKKKARITIRRGAPDCAKMHAASVWIRLACPIVELRRHRDLYMPAINDKFSSERVRGRQPPCVIFHSRPEVDGRDSG